MPTTVSRASLLREQIADAEIELRRLDADSNAAQRMKKIADELRNFRVNVKASRAQLANFDSNIEETIESMRALADTSVSINSVGLVVNEAEHLAKLEKLVQQLKNVLLSRARHRHQLRGLEDRLTGMESANLQLPPKYRV